MLQHWYFAATALVRRPALSVAVITTLAIAIGANSAIWSAIDTVLLKSLPFPAADRLVAVYETNASEGRLKSQAAIVRLREWADQTQAFDGLAGIYFENVTDTSGAEPERLAAMRTSAGFFSVLGVPPVIGRAPTQQEETLGGPGVVVIAERMWQLRFNRDPGVIGRTLVLGGVPRTIVGVMPASFRYPTAETDAWIPAEVTPSLANARQARFWTVVGRIRPGMTLDQAQQDLAAVQARLSQQYPASDKAWTATIVPLHEEQVGDWQQSLWLTLGAGALVLLIACANIALLLLADFGRRQHDIAMRFALGATRRRVVAHHLREGILLALAGAASGLLVAAWGIDALGAMATTVLPRVDELRVDARLMGFALTVGLCTTIMFSLGPALLATRAGVMGRVTHGVRGQVSGFRLFQRSLVVAQIGLAVVLLVGAGLLVRSLYALHQVSPGFRAGQVLAFRMSATWSERPEAVMNRQMRTLERLKALPGVTSAALSTIIPATATEDYTPTAFAIGGRARDESQVAIVRMVSADYFKTLSVPVEQGETCRDDPRSTDVTRAVVNRAFVTRFLSGENPIGRSIVTRSPRQIVGVVADARELSLTEELQPVVYTCGLMPFYPDPYYLVSMDSSRPATMTMIRTALKEIEPQRAVYAATTIDAALRETNAQSRLTTVLLSLFAGMSLLLVMVGMYGLLAQFVAERHREIGVRMALGARPAQVLRQVMRQSAVVTMAGLVLGMASALALSGVMRSVLFGVSPHDPFTFMAVPVALALITGAVSILPARRAARVDPLVALRYE